MTGHNDLATNVREARLAAGLTVESLAFKAGVAVRTVSRIERAEHTTTDAVLKAVARALETTPEALRGVNNGEAA